MPSLGVTGGIGTGKTTFAREFVHRTSAEFFDADTYARELLDSDKDLQDRVRREFPEALDSGGIDREKLRELIFGDASKRALLESILHPEIRSRWLEKARASATSDRWFVADIPLLFETGAESHFDRIIVVACSAETQRLRLEGIRGIDAALADKMIAAQIDLREKVAKANHLIWNDSTLAAMNGQTDLLIAGLQNCHV